MYSVTYKGFPMLFNREPRYVVFKDKDIQKYLTTQERTVLNAIAARINYHRDKEGRGLLVAAVVEQDWPEYEVVWKLVEERVKNVSVAKENLSETSNPR